MPTGKLLDSIILGLDLDLVVGGVFGRWSRSGTRRIDVDGAGLDPTFKDIFLEDMIFLLTDLEGRTGGDGRVWKVNLISSLCPSPN